MTIGSNERFEEESNKQVGENLLLEWSREPCAEELWAALEIASIHPKRGIAELEALAHGGSCLAKFYLGDIFVFGRYGLDRDLDRADSWLEAGSRSGSTEAAYLYAKFLEGDGRQKKAMTIYEKLANQGFCPAMFAVGMRYLNGDGVKQDERRGLNYLRSARNKGHFHARHWHAYLLRNGRFGLLARLRGWLETISLMFWLCTKKNKNLNSDIYRK